MSNLAVLSLKNRALIALITIVAAVFGGLALTSLKQELIPSIEFPTLAVLTTYPGASPEVVNNDVSVPIEAAIQAVPGLESTTATSSTNSSIISASFTFGTDLATAEQKIVQAINRISGQLPPDVDPLVLSASIDDFPVIQLAVSGYDDPAAIQDRLESVIVPEIEDVDGVNAAAIVGGRGQRVTIVPDQTALIQAGFSQTAITDALDANGILFPGGQITEDGRTLTVQTGVTLGSADDIAALPLVATDPEQAAAGVTTIGDVAQVAQVEDPVQSISRVDGEPALTISVTKLPAANTVDVSRGVLAILPQLADDLDGADISVVFDQAPFIQQSIDTLAKEGLLGLVFAVLIILVFLLSVRSTLVTAISIPTSVLITLIGIQAFGYSLNILTLGALTISIGRVVDDSIVVIENIKRHYVGGADKLRSIIVSVREVAGAITASTITTVVVFLPIAFVGDVTGELFRPFALTVAIALSASLLVSLTIVPVLAYWFLRPGKPAVDDAGRPVDPESPEVAPTRLQRSYLPVIRWTLRHSALTLVLAVVVLAGTVALAPLMKTNFLGDSGQNTFTMTQNLEPGASLEVQDQKAAEVEALLADIRGIDIVQVSIGSSGSALRDAFTGTGAGITYSVTTATGVDQVALRDEVLAAVSELDDPGTVTIAGGGGFAGGGDIEVDVTAADVEGLRTATDAVVASLQDADAGDVSSNLTDALPFISVQVDRAAAAERGVSEVAVAGLVAAAMQPQPIGNVEIDDRTLTVFLQSQTPPATIGELRALTIPTALGPVPLDQIAAVDEALSPTTVTVQRGLRTATVTVVPATDDLTAASAAVNQALADVDLPTGTDAAVGGVVTQQQDAFAQLGLALLAAILIVYVVMVATFKSLLQPLLLLISVPFAATGTILLLVVTGIPLGVSSLIGVLMLIGIVVTNAIVLIDLVNQYRERGMSVRDAVEAGAIRRFRPIIMTALATIFALTPLAFALTGGGGFISQPLAIVVIGGLVSSTVLTLVVLPTLYHLVEGGRERRRERRAARAGDGDAATAGTGETPAPQTRRARRAGVAAASVAATSSAASSPDGAATVSAHADGAIAADTDSGDTGSGGDADAPSDPAQEQEGRDRVVSTR